MSLLKARLNMLNHWSGVIEDENITWALYSIHDNYNKPELSEATEGTKVIGLYHGTIVGAKLNNGTEIDCGLYENAFDGCDAVMAIKRGEKEQWAALEDYVYGF